MKYPEVVTIMYSGERLDTGGDGNFAIFVDEDEDYRVVNTPEEVLALLPKIYKRKNETRIS